MKRLEPTIRRADILSAAVTAASVKGYLNVTRLDIAQQAGVSEGLITHYFTSMSAMRSAIMSEAVRLRCLSIIRDGIAHRDPLAAEASKELQKQALAG